MISSVWSEALTTGDLFSMYKSVPEYGLNSPAVKTVQVAVLPSHVTVSAVWNPPGFPAISGPWLGFAYTEPVVAAVPNNLFVFVGPRSDEINDIFRIIETNVCSLNISDSNDNQPKFGVADTSQSSPSCTNLYRTILEKSLWTNVFV